MPQLKGHLKKEKLKALLNIPKNCIHSDRLNKDSGDIICPSYIIIEHDGCVVSGGCDAVAVHMGKRRALLIEVKGGNIDQHDASDAVRQLKACHEYYRDKLSFFDFIPIFLKVGRKRLEIYARNELNKLRGIHIGKSGDDLSLIK
jgi:hypothetical protein